MANAVTKAVATKVARVPDATRRVAVPVAKAPTIPISAASVETIPEPTGRAPMDATTAVTSATAVLATAVMAATLGKVDTAVTSATAALAVLATTVDVTAALDSPEGLREAPAFDEDVRIELVFQGVGHVVLIGLDDVVQAENNGLDDLKRSLINARKPVPVEVL